MGGPGGGNAAGLVFYAKSYHPIQSGSIDGTDVLPHDNAVYRALLCSSAGLYDPFGDPKVIGDPYCTLFVGHLSHLTDEISLRKAMSKYGRVTQLRLVRHIVTGASRGYAFVEYETERDMKRAYKEAHHSYIDDSEIIVEYNRQQLMSGWIPRRLGGGLGGRKESGQLRFGGRDRPFRAPLTDGRPIPWDDLKKLGIPPHPEGHYLTRSQIPSPPRRRSDDYEDLSSKRMRTDMEVSPRKKRRSNCENYLSRRRNETPNRDDTPSRDDTPNIHLKHQSDHSIDGISRKHHRHQSGHSEDHISRKHHRHQSGHLEDHISRRHHRRHSDHSGDNRFISHNMYQSERSEDHISRRHHVRHSDHSGDDSSSFREHHSYKSEHSGDDSFREHHSYKSEHSDDDRTCRNYGYSQRDW